MKISQAKVEGVLDNARKIKLSGDISTNNIRISGGISTGNGVKDYNKLDNKPSINYITLKGNKLSEELGLEPTIIDITEQDIDNMIYGGN